MPITGAELATPATARARSSALGTGEEKWPGLTYCGGGSGTKFVQNSGVEAIRVSTLRYVNFSDDTR